MFNGELKMRKLIINIEGSELRIVYSVLNIEY